MLGNEKFVSKAPAVQDRRGEGKAGKIYPDDGSGKGALKPAAVKGKLQVLKVIGSNNMRAEGSVIKYGAAFRFLSRCENADGVL